MKHQHRRLEILAPAGDAEMLSAAVFSGADSVYLGVRGFNARRTAANFDANGLKRAAAFCHARRCGVYAALNTLVLPGQEEALAAAIRAVENAGCDAVIVQDLAAARMVRQIAPGLCLHASTQMSVHSLAGVRQLAALGFSRVILARELSAEEIAVIAKQSPIELEVFVHGALCVCISGQCLMSAFLGGRSANRGACAGPCRLPFSPSLSLKDLSILHALPRLAEMGVVSAKIEGRLRGPEYCAAVVDAAVKARDGLAWDNDLVRDVFSRSGFTDDWFTGKNTGEMFGVRTGQDKAAAKRAQPKARALYRRERPRVPVAMALRLCASGAKLTASTLAPAANAPGPAHTGIKTALAHLRQPLPTAHEDPAPALREALQKTGGTPFFAASPPGVETNGFHLSAAQAGALRREALGQLLALLEKGPARATDSPPVEGGTLCVERGLRSKHASPLAGCPKGGVVHGLTALSHASALPLLRARFETLAQMPASAPKHCHTLLLPLWEAEKVPPALRAKTLLWLPRALFGKLEDEAARRIAQAAQWGFAGFEAQNIAHLWLLQGHNVSAGFGLNLTGAAAVDTVAALGAQTVTLSAELSLAQMRRVAHRARESGGPATDALCYGHLPLMLTRACPLKQLRGKNPCQNCPHQGSLTGRKGETFAVLCAHGTRSIHNAVPLWCADKLHLLPTEYATLYFTLEDSAQAGQVLEAFATQSPAPGHFTRGLYTAGVHEE